MHRPAWGKVKNSTQKAYRFLLARQLLCAGCSETEGQSNGITASYIE